MLVLSDKNGKNWGVFVYHNGGERAIYTREVEYEGTAPQEARISSFERQFRILVGTDGTLYTYPVHNY